MTTNWTNKAVAESAWEMIALVNGAQGCISILAEGVASGVLLDALEDLVFFATRNPDVMPAWLHERYRKFLTNKGFRWDATTDVTKKTSRALVDWDDLSPSETAEYAIFMGVLNIITRGPLAKPAKKTPGPKRGKKKADADAIVAAAAEAAAAGGESVTIL